MKGCSTVFIIVILFFVVHPFFTFLCFNLFGDAGGVLWFFGAPITAVILLARNAKKKSAEADVLNNMLVSKSGTSNKHNKPLKAKSTGPRIPQPPTPPPLPLRKPPITTQEWLLAHPITRTERDSEIIQQERAKFCATIPTFDESIFRAQLRELVEQYQVALQKNDIDSLARLTTPGCMARRQFRQLCQSLPPNSSASPDIDFTQILAYSTDSSVDTIQVHITLQKPSLPVGSAEIPEARFYDWTLYRKAAERFDNEHPLQGLCRKCGNTLPQPRQQSPVCTHCHEPAWGGDYGWKIMRTGDEISNPAEPSQEQQQALTSKAPSISIVEAQEIAQTWMSRILYGIIKADIKPLQKVLSPATHKKINQFIDPKHPEFYAADFCPIALVNLEEKEAGFLAHFSTVLFFARRNQSGEWIDPNPIATRFDIALRYDLQTQEWAVDDVSNEELGYHQYAYEKMPPNANIETI